jgi:hypothetical protein
LAVLCFAKHSLLRFDTGFLKPVSKILIKKRILHRLLNPYPYAGINYIKAGEKLQYYFIIYQI